MTRLTALAAAFTLLCWSGAAAADVSMHWQASESPGQCDASRPIDPHVPSQFVIGLTARGTHLTLQFIGWRLPVNPDNSMKVKLRFDDGDPVETDALLISRISAFQLFAAAMPIGEAGFWQQLQRARRLGITGPFQPGRVVIDLAGLGDALPLLKDCAARQLPGQPLPFPP